MSLDKIMGELDRMTWERDSAKREIRILKDKIYGMNREIERLKRGPLVELEDKVRLIKDGKIYKL
jgi:hypothetical protein